MAASFQPLRPRRSQQDRTKARAPGCPCLHFRTRNRRFNSSAQGHFWPRGAAPLCPNQCELKRKWYPTATVPDVALTHDTPFLGVPANSNKGHVGRISDGVIDLQFGHEVTATGPRVTTTAGYPAGRSYTVIEETDFEGNPTRTVYPSGREVLFDIDNAGRLTRVRLKTGTVVTNLVSGVEPSRTFAPTISDGRCSPAMRLEQRSGPSPIFPSAASEPLRAFRPKPASPASGSSPRAASTKTGCATTTRRPGGTSRPTRWGWWTGRACLGMWHRIREEELIQWAFTAPREPPFLNSAW